MTSLRGSLAQQMETLNHRLLRMTSQVDEALSLAMQSLLERDVGLARRVIEGDATINRLRYHVEEQCYSILATQQPLAGDLRRVVAVVSIATNLERMGDHAAGIAVLTHRLSQEAALPTLVELPRMTEVARQMLRHSLDAYLQVDGEMAREVASSDRLINQLNEQALQRLLATMVEDPTTIRCATYLLWVTHNLERIGDRCKNICERVAYIATGDLADFDLASEEMESGGER